MPSPPEALMPNLAAVRGHLDGVLYREETAVIDYKRSLFHHMMYRLAVARATLVPPGKRRRRQVIFLASDGMPAATGAIQGGAAFATCGLANERGPRPRQRLLIAQR
ncbi:hypothetical protein GCM10012275_51870 [Longimycelium tulufanense]|uniref:Uncharacterized protein n=1 Tax=Longimycelium tulufanense TaxID=907463 RepID=A0A8J3FWW2_9PSEU|nr:hypothetical protein GCM10012275_51870 [Longimycelium tulufanense]